MYIIEEIQTNGNSTSILPAKTFTNKYEAESAYHLALASAAISNIEVHTVMLHDEHGNIIYREFYEHLS